VQNASAAAWSPRGDKIAYVNHEGATNVIYILDLATQEILSIEDPNTIRDAGWPAWNSAGTLLAYTWDDHNQGEYNIRIRQVVDETTGDLISNGNDREITSSVYAASALDWSRGDNFLAFKAAAALQIVNVTSLEIETLQDTTWAESPTWMPGNETELVFMNRNGRSGAGKRKIVKRNLSMQVETVIVERTGYHLYEPDWRR
jgi:Tol biopolymer transport system component